MKIYNVSDTKRFFETLMTCEGDIEVVSNEGMHITLSEDRNSENLKVMAETFVSGMIKELELSFNNPKDAVKICEFLATMELAA